MKTMSGTKTQQNRQTCRSCDSAMRHEGKSPPAGDGHHRTVFYCPNCEKTRQRG